MTILTAHHRDNTISSASRFDVVVAQLTCGPTNIAALTGYFSGDVAGVQRKVQISERSFV